MKRICGLVVVAGCLGACSVGAQDFAVKLSLKNAHLREVFFGYSVKATKGYDRKVDDFAPPPGIQTGYVGFIPGVKNLPLYYKDIRGPEPEQVWHFYTKVHQGKPLSISWQQDAIPKNWSLTMQRKKEKIDMRKSSSITLQESQTLTITGKRIEEAKGNK